MHRLRPRRPSPSMAVALAALFVALAGTAAAAGFGPFNGNSIIEKHSLSGNRLKNGTITGTQVNAGTLGKVPSASHADTAGSATSANTANFATTASPLAFGDVRSDGTLSANASSKGVASISHTAGSGIYCISAAAGLSFSGAVLTATPDFSNDSTIAGSGHAIVETRSSGFDCANGQLEVITFQASNSGAVTAQDQGFEFAVEH